jgi:RNA polymerase sigma-70 factor, ECF subfamily
VDYKTLDDETLIQFILLAHADALGEFYDRYQRLVFGLAFNVIQDEGLAEEITQDVFLRVWDKAASYRPEAAKVVTWLARITRNRAIDILRQQKSRLEKFAVPWDDLQALEPRASQNVEESADMASQQTLIRQALQQLPKEQREALALAYFRGLTQEEIAQELGEPLGTVKTRIRIGMQKLRQFIQSSNIPV